MLTIATCVPASKASHSLRLIASGDIVPLLSHRDLVHVAPAPVLARLERAHDRMLHRPEVLRRVLVLRRVAAPDVPAREAEPQVHPRVADAQALLASAALWFRVLHRVEMVARRHGPLS